MKIVLDLTEEQLGLLQSGLAQVEEVYQDLGDMDTAKAADEAFREIENAKGLDLSMENMTLEEVFSRAWSSMIRVWRDESERAERLEAEGISAAIALFRSEVAWKKQEELHRILLVMEHRRLGDAK